MFSFCGIGQCVTPRSLMALSSSFHTSRRSRAVLEGTRLHFVENSMPSLASSPKRFPLSSVASLRGLGQAGVRRGIIRDTSDPGLRAMALQGGARAPRRMIDFVKGIPNVSRAYFRSPFRRALYGGISVLGGFFIAHVITLSYGALGLNDVVAAALSLLFVEYITKYYHTRSQMTFTIALVNNFKVGFTYGLFMDAFKIAS